MMFNGLMMIIAGALNMKNKDEEDSTCTLASGWRILIVSLLVLYQALIQK